MNEIKVKSLLKTPYLITRDMADELEVDYSPESIFDFSEVDFVSAAFADQFKRKFVKFQIINAEQNVKQMLLSVSNRTN